MEATTRDQLVTDWVASRFPDQSVRITPASADASFRRYFRLDDAQGGSHIVMDSPPGLEDVRPWLRMHDLLEPNGVRVPRVLARDEEQGFLLLEDLGGPTLARHIDDANADAWFDAAFAQLIRLQQIPVPEGMGSFGEALLQRDAGLFDEWFLQRHLGLQLDCGELETLQLAHRRLMDNALQQPQVLTHRDFMPRNLMPIDGGPAVLDFQDLVRGPIAYDPVSLFKDAFLSWPIERVDGWLARYHARATRAGVPVPELKIFLRDADWMGIQRHLKILGIFSRLHYRDGKTRYLPDVPRFIRYLDEVLPRYPELAGLRTLLDKRIKPVLHARGEIA